MSELPEFITSQEARQILGGLSRNVFNANFRRHLHLWASPGDFVHKWFSRKEVLALQKGTPREEPLYTPLDPSASVSHRATILDGHLALHWQVEDEQYVRVFSQAETQNLLKFMFAHREEIEQMGE